MGAITSYPGSCLKSLVSQKLTKGIQYENEVIESYKKAFDIFQTSHDEIFMLLVSRVVIGYLEENANGEFDQRELHDFKKIYDGLVTREDISNLNLAVLFENFDHRMSMAKHVSTISLM